MTYGRRSRARSGRRDERKPVRRVVILGGVLIVLIAIALLARIWIA